MKKAGRTWRVHGISTAAPETIQIYEKRWPGQPVWLAISAASLSLKPL
jgi:hypothetical protein